MTAAELIDLLKRHPKACERLGITLGQTGGLPWAAIDSTYDTFDAENGQVDAEFMRRWLLGACVEWCDEHGIAVHRDGDSYSCGLWDLDDELKHYETRLHACLAAIEATA